MIHTLGAYPAFNGGADQSPSFVLFESPANGLYYVNALEAKASAMEISAIAAKNVALLLNQKLPVAQEAQEAEVPLAASTRKKHQTEEL